MPTKREREYYRMGFMDAMQQGIRSSGGTAGGEFTERINGRVYDELGQAYPTMGQQVRGIMEGAGLTSRVVKPKRKLSAWNKYVKANSKKPRFRYRNGKLNLKKMAVAFRKTQKRGGKR
jgi:hypothetical protein